MVEGRDFRRIGFFGEKKLQNIAGNNYIVEIVSL